MLTVQLIELIPEQYQQQVGCRLSDVGSCIVWGGYISDRGYAIFGRSKGTRFLHRIAYEWARGPIPEGMALDHLCRNRACVNPDHLEVVDGRTNNLRGEGPAAKNAIKTHCPQGHEYSPENTHVYKRQRMCRKCRRVYADRWANNNREKKLAYGRNSYHKRKDSVSPTLLKRRIESLSADLAVAGRTLKLAQGRALQHLADVYWWVSMDEDQTPARRGQCRRAMRLLSHWAQLFGVESEQREPRK
jgi:hypothetical protein